MKIVRNNYYEALKSKTPTPGSMAQGRGSMMMEIAESFSTLILA